MARKSLEAKKRQAVYGREYNRTHRDLRNAYSRDWCKRNPERRFMRYLRHRLKSRYGLTVVQYQEMIEKQNGLCPICAEALHIPTKDNRVRNGDSAVVDHKGKTVRGVLCNNCNRAIGLLKDDPENLIRVVDYLTRERE